MNTLAFGNHEWMLLTGAAIGCSLIMALLWAIATKIRDASCVDVAWAGLLGVSALYYAFLGDGTFERRALIGAIGGLWGLRLCLHLLRDRILKATEEDGRYQALRASWGKDATWKFFVFFQAQAVLDITLAIPFLVAASNTEPFALADKIGGALWIVGFIGESIADAQLAKWRRNPSNKRRTCRSGLWRYSRHPNYFFEWMMWCSFAIVASGWPIDASWLSWVAPAAMLFFIFKITGIPPTEERALLSRGDDYREYQRTTSVFIPWFPREGGRS